MKPSPMFITLIISGKDNKSKQVLEGEQERREKIKKQMENRNLGIKDKYQQGIIAIVAIVSSLAQKIRDFSIVAASRVYTNEES